MPLVSSLEASERPTQVLPGLTSRMRSTSSLEVPKSFDVEFWCVKYDSNGQEAKFQDIKSRNAFV